MTYHYTLLAAAYDSTCEKLADGGEINKRVKLEAANHTIDAYFEILGNEPDTQDKLDGLIATRQFQRAKTFELLGATV